jgi:hypothetical protein
MMSTQTDPILEPYDPDALAVAHGYLARNLDEMMRELVQHRERPCRCSTLVNWNWARTGQHLESGRVSIRQLVEHMVEHEAAHLHDAAADVMVRSGRLATAITARPPERI